MRLNGVFDTYIAEFFPRPKVLEPLSDSFYRPLTHAAGRGAGVDFVASGHAEPAETT
jgi:hypothetical protein